MKKFLLTLLGVLALGSVCAFADEVEVTTFTAVNGKLDNNISYTTAQGGGTTPPGIYSNKIRLYQKNGGGDGGSITITANNNCTINSVIIGSSTATTVKYQANNGAVVTDQDITANGKLTVNDLTATSITFTCNGKDKDHRFNVNYIKVVYTSETLPAGDVTSSPAAVDGKIEVVRGTEITFESLNAENLAIKVNDEAELTVANPYTYTATANATVTVTPVQKGAKVADKEAHFTIAIQAAAPCGEVVFDPASGAEIATAANITATAVNAVKYEYFFGTAEPTSVEGETLTVTAPAEAGVATLTVTPYNADGVAGTTATATYTVKEPAIQTATFDFAAVGNTNKDKYGQSTTTNDQTNPIVTEATTLTENAGNVVVTMVIEDRHRNWGGKLRLQKKSNGGNDAGYFTLSVDAEYIITKVEFTTSPALNAEPGNYDGPTWTPAEGVETNTIKFTTSGSSNVDIAAFTVTVARKPAAKPEFTTELTVGEPDYNFTEGTLTLPYSFTVVNATGEPEFTLTVTDSEDAVVEGVNWENIPAAAPGAAPARVAAEAKTYEGQIVATSDAFKTSGKVYRAALSVSVDGVVSSAAPAEITTGVENIIVDENAAAVEYYNLQGVRVDNPSAGLYIRRQGNTCTKVYIR